MLEFEKLITFSSQISSFDECMNSSLSQRKIHECIWIEVLNEFWFSQKSQSNPKYRGKRIVRLENTIIRKAQNWNLIKHEQLIFWKFLLIYIDLFKNKTLIYFTKNKNRPFYIFTQKHQLIQTMIFYIYFCKKFVWYHTNFFSSKMRYDYKLKKTEKHLFYNFDSLL